MSTQNVWENAGDGRLAEVKESFAKGEHSPLSRDDHGYTPLMAAVSYGHIELLEYLITYLCDNLQEVVELEETRMPQKTEDDATDAGASGEDESTISQLKAILGQDATSQDVNNTEEATKEERQEKRRKSILKVVLNMADAEGDCCFHHFCYNLSDIPEDNRKQVLNFLTNNGADSDKENAEGRNPLDVCVEYDADALVWLGEALGVSAEILEQLKANQLSGVEEGEDEEGQADDQADDETTTTD